MTITSNDSKYQDKDYDPKYNPTYKNFTAIEYQLFYVLLCFIITHKKNYITYFGTLLKIRIVYHHL